MSDVRLVFEGTLDDPDVEDDGQAIIALIERCVDGPLIDPTGDTGIFVRIQSWDATLQHTQWALIAGRRVRVTVETISEPDAT